jgi:hypothetical protein
MANATNYSKNSKCHENDEMMANDGKNGKTQKMMAKMRDHDHDYDQEREREREKDTKKDKETDKDPPPPLSFDIAFTGIRPEEGQDIVSRVEHHRRHWESRGLPPSPIIMGPDVLDRVKPTTDSFPAEKIDEAITNFKAVVSQPDFDPDILPGGHIPNFKNFMIRWVDRFTNEARPLEVYGRKIKTGPPGKGPDWGGAVDMGSPGKPRSIFDEGGG